LEDHPHHPYNQYGSHPTYVDTETVLKNHASTKYAQFGYSTPLDWEKGMGGKISASIVPVKQRVPKIYCGRSQGLVEHHNHIKKHVEQIALRPRPFDPISAAPVYGECGIDTPEFPFLFSSAQYWYGCTGLTEGLEVDSYHIQTALNNGVHMNTAYLKPIDFFIILILEDGSHKAVVSSNDIFNTAYRKLQRGTQNPLVKHKAFMVSSGGLLIQRGKGQLAPKEEDVQRIMKSEWMRDLVIDAALLTGQIAHPDRLLERIKNWKSPETFEEFWKRIVAAQPNPETANVLGMKRLLGK
jgi:hypothetical protein